MLSLHDALPISGDFDLIAKKQVDRRAPEAMRPVSDAVIRAFDALSEAGKVRRRLNTTFLTGADATSPELAGIWGAAKGSLLTMLVRSEEHTSELQSLMRISYAVFCFKKK